MKNITKQYQDLLEGKMSKANFMVNVRRDFPQWISPVNSFQDAVNILKSKRILVETNLSDYSTPTRIAGETAPKDVTNITNDWKSLDINTRKEVLSACGLGDEFAEMDFETLERSLEPGSVSQSKLRKLIRQAAEDESMVSQMQSKQAGEFDPNNPGKYSTLERRELNEAAQKPEGRYKEATGKVEYDKFAEMDRVHYNQLMKGMEFELLKMPEISDENLVKAKKKAYSNLAKNPKYYMHLLINNEKDVEKRDKDLRMQPVKDDNRVDKANAMKVVKKDEGSNTQESLGNKEKAKGMPKGVKELPEKGVIGTEKVLREGLVKQLKEEIMDEMMMAVGEKKTSFNKGARVETRDGQIGTVEECTPDNTVIIKLDGGGTIHMQGNVLKPYQDAPMVSQPVVAVQDMPAIAPEEPIADKFKGLKDKLVKGLKEKLDQQTIASAKQGRIVPNVPKGSQDEKTAQAAKITYSTY